MPYPHVDFALFWECERVYDGVTFQYSLNEGASWTNVGGYDDPVNCLSDNWFNAASITNLDLVLEPEGWSGRVDPTVGGCGGGAGSGQWVRASHCLDGLGGEPSVKLRFVFGAGTFCNDYDGIAIDDFRLVNATVQSAMDYQCSGTTVDFQETTSPCSVTRVWDFGDPASGAANTSTLDAPSHAYGASGTYAVTLTVTGPCGDISSVVQQVVVLDVVVQTADPDCNGTLGTATAVVSGGAGPFTYSWSPGGASTQTITGLAPGTYTVTVGGANVCGSQATATVGAATAGPSVSATATDVSCNGLSDGTVTVAASAGTPPYAYAWSPQGGSSATAAGLPPGTYTCTVTDASGCSASASATVAEPAALTVQAEADRTICAGTTTTLLAEAAGGAPAYTYAWSPEGPDVTPAVVTTYTVTATDANGCTSPTDDVTITPSGPAAPTFTVDDPAGCAPHCTGFTITAPEAGGYTWDLGDGNTSTDVAPEHCYAASGTYTVRLTLTDAAGCTGTFELPDAVNAQPTPVASFFATPPVTTIEEAHVPVHQHFLRCGGVVLVVR